MKRLIVASFVIALAGIAVIAVLAARRDTPPLTGGDWVIEDIGGRGVVDGSPAALAFQPDGGLSGNASCNRLIGTYVAGEDGALALSPAGTTMMACPPALMEQEQRLLTFLPEVTEYRIDNTGALILQAKDGQTIRAHRR